MDKEISLSKYGSKMIFYLIVANIVIVDRHEQEKKRQHTKCPNRCSLLRPSLQLHVIIVVQYVENMFDSLTDYRQQNAGKHSLRQKQ